MTLDYATLDLTNDSDVIPTHHFMVSRQTQEVYETHPHKFVATESGGTLCDMTHAHGRKHRTDIRASVRRACMPTRLGWEPRVTDAYTLRGIG